MEYIITVAFLLILAGVFEVKTNQGTKKRRELLGEAKQVAARPPARQTRAQGA